MLSFWKSVKIVRKTRLSCESLDERVVPDATGPLETMNFDLSDGNSGSLTFSLPAFQVDPSQGNQAIAVGDAQLTLAGHTFSEASGDLGPNGVNADFNSGIFAGANFGIEIMPGTIPNYPYMGIALNGFQVSAITPNGNFFNAVASPITFSATLDFSGITIPSAGNNYFMRFQAAATNGTDPDIKLDTTFQIGSNTAVSDVITGIETALTNAGFAVKVNGNKMAISGTSPSQLKSITITSYTAMDANKSPIPNNTITGPKVTMLSGIGTALPSVTYNGNSLSP